MRMECRKCQAESPTMREDESMNKLFNFNWMITRNREKLLLSAPKKKYIFVFVFLERSALQAAKIEVVECTFLEVPLIALP